MNSDTGIKLPFSEDAERGLISSLLLGGEKVAVEITVPKEAFYIPAHQLLWETLNDLLIEKRPLEFVMVKHRLIQLSQLEEIGVAYLDSLYSFVPTWENYRYYVELVLDKWRMRKAMLGLHKIGERLQDPGTDTFKELRGDIEDSLIKMISDEKPGEVDTKEFTMRWLDDLATRKERLAKDGIAFGIVGLDTTVGMQQPGELTIIGSATSSGKSMLAYQGIVYNSLVKKLPVGLVSLEMTALQTWDRLTSHIERISMTHFRDGEFSETEFENLHKASMKIMTQMPFYFCRGRLNIDRVQSWARRMKARHGIKLLVVDYLQRVDVRKEMQRHSRQEQVSYISNALKDLALELNIVIWCPVQLNKEFEVRESSTIQFDADIAIRLVLDKESDVHGQIIFDKNRQGQKATNLPITIKGWFQTIEEREVGRS